MKLPALLGIESWICLIPKPMLPRFAIWTWARAALTFKGQHLSGCSPVILPSQSHIPSLDRHTLGIPDLVRTVHVT